MVSEEVEVVLTPVVSSALVESVTVVLAEVVCGSAVGTEVGSGIIVPGSDV